ncbi:rCG49783 [Rattus norvegicus]|uniref:RCG49783 n=1 Tax=Rattus norvegicus TaxID=10116 RepID=A6K4N0_RAT|nr:rCG49783 [Rattus norvegicus]
MCSALEGIKPPFKACWRRKESFCILMACLWLCLLPPSSRD